jgi:hypothetical protein
MNNKTVLLLELLFLKPIKLINPPIITRNLISKYGFWLNHTSSVAVVSLTIITAIVPDNQVRAEYQKNVVGNLFVDYWLLLLTF